MSACWFLFFIHSLGLLLACRILQRLPDGMPRRMAAAALMSKLLALSALVYAVFNGILLACLFWLCWSDSFFVSSGAYALWMALVILMGVFLLLWFNVMIDDEIHSQQAGGAHGTTSPAPPVYRGSGRSGSRP